MSEWADANRYLPSDSPEPGRYHSERVPYFKAVMDAFTEPSVKRVVVKSAAQVGKSEVLLNVVGRFAQLDPCPMMIIQPTLELAQDFSKARLARMIADSPVLTPLFYDKERTRDANQTILSKFYKGGRVTLIGANSPAGLASRPIKILLCDEVDRYPPTTREGDPVDLAAKRTSNYWDAKVGLFSTPTTAGASRIEIEYLSGTQEEWRHRCPHCGEWHLLDFQDMTADSTERLDETGHKSVLVKSVRWRCPDCGFEFEERAMRQAEQRYFVRNADVQDVRSFHVNGFASPWLNWQSVMREWLESRGNASREAVVMNTRFGRTYTFRDEAGDEEIYLRRREAYDAEVPDGVKLLTCAVDVQGNRLEYEVAGWSVGFEKWGIVKGEIVGTPQSAGTWRGLDVVLDKEYKLADGSGMKISRTFIDSGFATAAVYAYCRRGKGRFAIKGKAGMGLPLLYKYGRTKGSSATLLILGVDDGKQEVMSRLRIELGSEGCMHFPLDDKHITRRGYDRRYFVGLLSERQVRRQSGGAIQLAWEPISRDVRNEPLDLAVYNLACAQSCVGKNEGFWTGTARKDSRIQHKAVDVWS